jgi:RNA polymerase alpha subunit
MARPEAQVSEEVTLWTKVDECGLSTRAINALKREGFDMLGQVVELVNQPSPWGRINPLATVLRLPNIGRQTATEIMDVIRPLVPAWPTDEAEFLDWCRRNRLVLELLRKNWHDPDFDEP